MSLDDHLRRVTPESYTALRATLEIMESNRLPYALIGGWAVFAYGSRIPSVDTDVLLSRDAAQQFRADLQAAGKADLEGPGKNIEILAMDEPNELHGFDWELEAVPAYTPSDILNGRIVDVDLDLESDILVANAPPPSTLAFMKLKAMHDRCFDYRAVTDPRAMARINPSARPLIAREPAGHSLRKAGKDLADVAFLCSGPTDLEAALEEVPSLRSHLEMALERVPRPIFDYAVGMASRDGASAKWIDAHANTAR